MQRNRVNYENILILFDTIDKNKTLISATIDVEFNYSNISNVYSKILDCKLNLYWLFCNNESVKINYKQNTYDELKILFYGFLHRKVKYKNKNFNISIKNIKKYTTSLAQMNEQ